MTPNDIILLARERRRADVQWRVWLLPPPSVAIEALFAIGEPTQNLPQPTTLTAAIPPATDPLGGAATPIDLEVGSAALYPASGAIAIADAFGNVAWWRYSDKDATTLRNATRLRGHQGAFEIGDDVDIRVLISDRLTSASVEEHEEYGPLGQVWLYDWEGRVEGEQFEADYLLEASTFLLEARYRADGIAAGEPWEGWTEWLVMARGYAADGYGITFDPTSGKRRWDGTIRSGRVFVERDEIDARHYGRTELEGDNATVSSTLASPQSVEPEEYIHHPGNSQGANICDGRNETRWISSNVPTMSISPYSPTFQEVGNRPIINAVGVVPVDGGQMLQWIEVVCDHYPLDLSGYVITIKHPTDPEQSTIMEQSGVAGNPYDPRDYCIPCPNVTLLPPPEGQVGVILTNNLALYQRYYGGTHFPAYDWRTLTGPDWYEFDNDYPARDVVLPTDAGAVAIRQMIQYLGVFTQDFAAYEAAGYGANPFNWFFPNDWAGGNTLLPLWGVDGNNPDSGVILGGPGSSIQRSPALIDTGRVTDFIVNGSPAPGDPAVVQDEAFFVLDMPQFVCTLAESITLASHPNGSTLTVNNATPLDGGGYIVIGNERIRYAINWAGDKFTQLQVVQRDVLGDGDTSHAEGATVQQYIEERNEASTYESVGQIEVYRPMFPAAPNGGGIRPKRMEIWAGNESAATSGPNWESTWYGGGPLHVLDVPDDQIEATIRLALRGWPTDIPSNRRYAQLWFRIFLMNDAGRAKVNEVRLWRSRSTEANNGEIGLGAIVRELLERSLDPEQIEINDAFAWVGDGTSYSTLGGGVEEPLRDILLQGLCAIRYKRDGGVAIEYAPHHPDYQRWVAPAMVMDGQMLRSQKLRVQPRLGGGPVRVRIINEQGNVADEATFPPYQRSGRVETLDLRITSGVAVDVRALAQALYRSNVQRSHEMSVAATGYMPTLQAGAWCVVPSYIETGEVRYHAMRIASIRHSTGGPTEITFVEWRTE